MKVFGAMISSDCGGSGWGLEPPPNRCLWGVERAGNRSGCDGRRFLSSWWKDARGH